MLAPRAPHLPALSHLAPLGEGRQGWGALSGTAGAARGLGSRDRNPLSWREGPRPLAPPRPAPCAAGRRCLCPWSEHPGNPPFSPPAESHSYSNHSAAGPRTPGHSIGARADAACPPPHFHFQPPAPSSSPPPPHLFSALYTRQRRGGAWENGVPPFRRRGFSPTSRLAGGGRGRAREGGRAGDTDRLTDRVTGRGGGCGGCPRDQGG